MKMGAVFRRMLLFSLYLLSSSTFFSRPCTILLSLLMWCLRAPAISCPSLDSHSFFKIPLAMKKISVLFLRAMAEKYHFRKYRWLWGNHVNFSMLTNQNKRKTKFKYQNCMSSQSRRLKVNEHLWVGFANSEAAVTNYLNMGKFYGGASALSIVKNALHCVMMPCECASK